MARKKRGKRGERHLFSGLVLLIAVAAAVILVVSAMGYAPGLYYGEGTTQRVENRKNGSSDGRYRPEHRNDKSVTASSQPGWQIALYALPLGSDTLYTLINEQGRYVVNYDPDTRNARWAAYILTRAEAGVSNAERSNRFTTDTRLSGRGWAAASTGDYTRSGYDRGHLVPSADRDDNQTENRATFVMTNISPQRPGLNRHVGKNLESRVRKWALEHDSLYIVTAGVLAPTAGRPLKTIGAGVAVPELFFKAIAVRDGDRFQAIGFVIPNIDDCNRDYRVYAVSPDSVRHLTGLDIFGALPAEEVYDTGFWF